MPWFAWVLITAIVVGGLCFLAWLGDRRSSSPTSPAVPHEPSAAIRQQQQAMQDALEGFRIAGFSDEQARELLQEMIRTQVRTAGGWQA